MLLFNHRNLGLLEVLRMFPPQSPGSKLSKLRVKYLALIKSLLGRWYILKAMNFGGGTWGLNVLIG